MVDVCHTLMRSVDVAKFHPSALLVHVFVFSKVHIYTVFDFFIYEQSEAA